MNGILHFETFLLAGVLLNLTPGNDTVFVLTKSVAHGKKAGVISAFGIGTGSVVHTILAALGLSIIVSESVVLFNIIKYAGMAYIIYVGLRMILESSRDTFIAENSDGTSGPGRIFLDAMLTNLLNPKVALFFLAFLPQFIDPHHGYSALPFLILGLTFTITGSIWCLILATLSARVSASLRRSNRLSSYMKRICGLVLIGLGLKLGFSGER